jgi:septal ring factor EnvC (AmiA/AmiB activator)
MGVPLKEIEAGFSEIEKRMRTLLADNAGLRKRVAELERELAQARAESGEFQNFHGKRLHIREKIENVLKSLESMGEKGT